MAKKLRILNPSKMTKKSSHQNHLTNMFKKPISTFTIIILTLLSVFIIKGCNYKNAKHFSPTGPNSEISLSIPQLVYPLNGATDVDQNLTFEWQTVDLATAYDFQIIKEGETFQNANGFSQSGLTSNMYPVEGLEYQTNYQWRVRATYEDLYSDWSGPWEFATIEGSSTTYELTVNKEGEGTVTSAPSGINCGNDCKENYEVDTEVTLTAEAADNWIFDGWNGDVPDNCNADSNNCKILIDGAKTVTAIFVEEQDKILQKGHFSVGLSYPEFPVYLAGAVDGYNSYNKKPRSSIADEVTFGDLTGTFITAFSGANGYQVLDLATGEVLLEETGLGGTGPFFGVAGATQDPPGENSAAMLSLAGANGYVLDRFDQAGPLEFDGTTFDVFPAGGDPVTDVVSYVRPDAGVYFFVFDDSQNLYVPAEVELPVNLFDDKELVSAYVHDDMLSNDAVPQPRGPVLVLTRETESGVYLSKWDGSDPVRAIDNIGFDARRIRCIDDGTGSGNLICAASIFGHDRLGLMTWDGENAPVLTDFAEIGDGPVGIDMRLLPSGNIGIVSTGFNDNTVTESIIGTDGRVESNNNRPAPGGCLNPGHAIYIEDDESLKILGTCYSSDSYFIVESEL